MKKLICAIIVSIFLAAVAWGQSQNKEDLMISKPVAVTKNCESTPAAVMTKDDFVKKLADLKAQRDQMQANLNALAGAIQMVEMLIQELDAKAKSEELKPVPRIVEPVPNATPKK